MDGKIWNPYRFKTRIPRYITSAVNHYHVISDKEKAERKYNMGQSARYSLISIQS